MTTHYVPILPTKAGELFALADLSATVRSKLTPLLAIHPIQFDFDTEMPSKTAADHVVGLGKKIARTWGTGRAFLDPIFLGDEPEPGGSEDPMQSVLTDAAQEGLHLVPVVSPGRHPNYTTTAASVHQDTGVGVCVRLSPRNWPTSPTRAHVIDDLLVAIGLGPGDADLVLDLGEDVHGELATELAGIAIQTLPHAELWRSITLAGGSFPENLSEIQKNRINRLPRLEQRLYEAVCTETAAAGLRVPTFGDYAVAHPDPTQGDVDPKLINISASLRYTLDGEWLVAKGELYKGTGGRSLGGAAAVPVAEMIANAPEFCGPDFSAGDTWIDQIARGQANGGNPQAWRRAGTSHHLTLVAENLSS